MALGTASQLSIVAIFVGVIGVFFLGLIALLIAIVLVAASVATLEGQLEGRVNPQPKESPHPMRFACPSCGGDAYTGQKFCADCGAKLPASSPPS